VTSNNGCPQTWYLVASADKINKGSIQTVTIGAQELVVYRGKENGKLHALDAHCSHMGCHFKHGEIIGDNLKCALHCRVFEGSGKCIAILKSKVNNLTSTQRSFPVLERFGGVFVFLGKTPLFELPNPNIVSGEDASTSFFKSSNFDVPWQSLVANGCDIDHLQAIHGRALIEEPMFQVLEPYEASINYRSIVTGNKLSDRVMRLVSKNNINVRITLYGGTMVLVESAVGSHRSFLLLSMIPTDSGTTIRGIVGVPKRMGMIPGSITVHLASWLFKSFLKNDIRILDSANFHGPHYENTLGDTIINCVLDYFRKLPVYQDNMGETLAIISAKKRLVNERSSK
jgi:aminopyrrolnitrin oxygenase